MEGNARGDSGARLLEAYVDWREESAALEEAYGRWSSAPGPDRDLACAAYKAALDREEQASIVYQNQLSQSAPQMPEVHDRFRTASRSL